MKRSITQRARRGSERVARKRARTREALLSVALGKFHEKGIYLTKIEDITEPADIGKGTFYKYFPTKDALLLTLLQSGLGALTAAIRARVQSTDNATQLIEGVIQTQVDFYLERPEYLLLFHQVRGMLQLRTYRVPEQFRTVCDDHLANLTQILRPALTRGHETSAARELSIAVSAFTVGLLTYHLLFDEADAVRRHKTRLSSQIVGAIENMRKELLVA